MNIAKKWSVFPGLYVWPVLMMLSIMAAAWVNIPFTAQGSVAVTLQGLFFMLTGLVLGSRVGPLVAVAYVGLGLLGLPVFPQGQSGMAALTGAYGGYLLGGVACAMSCSINTQRDAGSFQSVLMKCFSGYFIWLLLGSLMYKGATGVDFAQALATGFTPFIPSMVVLCAAAAGLYCFMRGKGWVR
ncbi:Biotin transporter BioY [Saezia sanguinis]|uniref:Biotin transporter n=1 Tax=Saezia sanguinis TaxID=1965230 RepID=A0A433SH99_9BURK|nr:biotin transporter BioY [Saezia sanguinis]RUS68113.1 Biotin transporter BioY [Saezia sanguinis]